MLVEDLPLARAALMGVMPAGGGRRGGGGGRNPNDSGERGGGHDGECESIGRAPPCGGERTLDAEKERESESELGELREAPNER